MDAARAWREKWSWWLVVSVVFVPLYMEVNRKAAELSAAQNLLCFLCSANLQV
jgi:nicotinamide riboside transporter PnuC